MTLHETWVSAKKQAWKEFKEAQKNYLKDQDKKIKATNDAKAKKKALDMVLGEAGLDKGEALEDYLKFADGFGKQLDTLEKAVDNNAKLKAKYDFSGLDQVLKNKDLAKQLLLFCQRTHDTPMITFYMRDYKKSATDIWNEYVDDGSPSWIDLGVNQKLQDDWRQAAASPATLNANGQKLIDRLRDHVKSELEESTVKKMAADATTNKNLGIVHSDTLKALAKEVNDTAQKYEQQIQSAVNRWSKLQPQFWQPLDDALDEIKLYAAKQLPKRG